MDRGLRRDRILLAPCPGEVIDDQYPVVLIARGTTVRRMAQENYGGDIEALLQSTIDQYEAAVTHRRPEEVISMYGLPRVGG